MNHYNSLAGPSSSSPASSPDDTAPHTHFRHHHTNGAGPSKPSTASANASAGPSAATTASTALGPLVEPHQDLNDFLESFWTKQMSYVERESPDFKTYPLPLARIKKVMKSDEEVKMISAEAPIMFSRACEIFIAELTCRAWLIAESNKRRTLQKSDVAAAIGLSDMFDFLIDILPRDDEEGDGGGGGEEQDGQDGQDGQEGQEGQEGYDGVEGQEEYEGVQGQEQYAQGMEGNGVGNGDQRIHGRTEQQRQHQQQQAGQGQGQSQNGSQAHTGPGQLGMYSGMY